MNKEDMKLDELFRSGLENYEVKPPEYVWDGILERQGAAQKGRRTLWWRVSAAAAALLLAFLLGWELQKDKPHSLDVPIVAQKDAHASFSKAEDEIRSQQSENQNQELSVSHAILAEKDKHTNSIEDEHAKFAFVSATANTQTTQSESAGEENLSLLTKISGTLGLEQVMTGKLAKIQRSDDLFSEEDRLIIAMNQAEQSLADNESRNLQWSVGAQLSPVFNVNQTKYSNQYAMGVKSSSSRDLNLGGGMTVAVKGAGRWSIQSGLMYSRLGQSSTVSSGPNSSFNEISSGNYFLAQRTSKGEVLLNGAAGPIHLNSLPKDMVFSADFESSSASLSSVAVNADFDQFFDYLEVPLFVRYQLVNRKVDVQLAAGINTGFLVRNAVFQSDDMGRSLVGKTADMSDLTFSSTFGFGLGYKLSPGLQFRVEPQMRYFLQSLSTNSDINYKPYSFGFSTGFSYSF